jgi:hypothetical protein
VFLFLLFFLLVFVLNWVFGMREMMMVMFIIIPSVLLRFRRDLSFLLVNPVVRGGSSYSLLWVVGLV